MTKKSTNTGRILLTFTSFTSIILLWKLVSLSLGDASAGILPSPESVVLILIFDCQRLGFHLGLTVLWTLCGFSLALAAGFIGGLLLNRWLFLDRFSQPILIFSQTIPTVFLFPLFQLWLGFGPWARILVVFLACFFPIIMNFLHGLNSVPRGYQDLFLTLRARTWQTILELKIPFALPQLFGGIKIAMAYALVSCIVGEWLGGKDGIGAYMALSVKNFSWEKSFAAVLLVSVISFIFFKLTQVLEKKILPWEKRS